MDRGFVNASMVFGGVSVAPGDLMLTTAFPIRDDPAAQVELISTIAQVGGAGLVVKPGLYLTDLPPGTGGSNKEFNIVKRIRGTLPTSLAPGMSRARPCEWMLGHTVSSMSPVMMTVGALIS